MADIFGRENSALEKAGDNLVKQVKEAHKQKRVQSRKEIEQAVKDSPLAFYNKKTVSVTMYHIPSKKWDKIFKKGQRAKAA